MTRHGNDTRKLLRMSAEGKLPLTGLWHVYALHDSWCAVLTCGGDCDCDPDLKIAKKPPKDRPVTGYYMP